MRNPYLVIIDVQEKLIPVIHDKDNLLSNLEILLWVSRFLGSQS